MTAYTTPYIGRVDQTSETAPIGNPNAWTVTVSTHASLPPVTLVQERSKRPDWRDKIKAGQDASNQYKKRTLTMTCTPLLGATRSAGSYPFHCRGNFVSSNLNYHPAFQPENVDIRDLALARVKRKINSLEQSYQALIPLAELREARGLFRQMVDYTYDMVQAVADLKRTKGKSLFRYVQQRWLIWSFGISPMINDLKGLGSAMWQYLTHGDIRDRVQGSAGTQWLSSARGDSITGLSSAAIKFDALAEHTLKYRYIAGWKFLIRSSNDYGMLQHFGVTPAALIPALWETMAYSWLVDYFTTTGAWLDDLFTGSAGTSMYVVQNRMYKMHSIATFDYYMLWGNQNYFTQRRVGKADLEYFEFERLPMAALPSRVLRFKTWDEVGKGALNKLLNLVSLTFRGEHWTDSKRPINVKEPYYRIRL